MDRKNFTIGLIALTITFVLGFFFLKPETPKKVYTTSEPSAARTALINATKSIVKNDFQTAEEELDLSEDLGMNPVEINGWRYILFLEKGNYFVEQGNKISALQAYKSALNYASNKSRQDEIKLKIKALN